MQIAAKLKERIRITNSISTFTVVYMGTQRIHFQILLVFAGFLMAPLEIHAPAHKRFWRGYNTMLFAMVKRAQTFSKEQTPFR